MHLHSYLHLLLEPLQPTGASVFAPSLLSVLVTRTLAAYQGRCGCIYILISICGDVAQLVVRQIGTHLMQVQFPGAARDFSPRVNFQCRLSCLYTSVCNYKHQHFAHVKAPVTQTEFGGF